MLRGRSDSAHQIKAAIEDLESLVVAPAAAARALQQIIDSDFSALAETIQSTPALTAKILSLAHRQRLDIDELGLIELIRILPQSTLAEAVLSAKVFQPIESDSSCSLSVEALSAHSLAVASAARAIGSLAMPRYAPETAFLAGLLHDIGKNALDSAMPKSFQKIVEEAELRQISICTVEQEKLGADHAVLGKRLAEKWQLPDDITIAIWLHHSDMELIWPRLEQMQIACIVQLADEIARQCGIGRSGSFAPPKDIYSLAQSLSISPSQIEQIKAELPNAVAAKSKPLAPADREYHEATAMAMIKLFADNEALQKSAEANERNKHLAEDFASLLSQPKDLPPAVGNEPNIIKAQPEQTAPAAKDESNIIEALAEVAAGAAHELNNPLAVISGRVQLLAQAEQDADKKQMLAQVQQRVDEITQIVGDLMGFAKPPKPQAKVVSPLVLIDEAISQTEAKRNSGKLQVHVTGVDELDDVNVDAEQIVSALANIMSNALDSYAGGEGPIEIAGLSGQTNGCAQLEITDHGSGMTAEVLKKACQPFFSAKTAGRQRGMGLAQAQRLVKLNQGSIAVDSTPEVGTKVTIQLPMHKSE